MLNKKKNNKGFTLVELLVVIAIIGILAVVAVPALFSNIEKSKVAKLESNISAIKSAALTYYTDNNTYFETQSNASTIEQLQSGSLGEYLEDLKSAFGSETYGIAGKVDANNGNSILTINLGKSKLSSKAIKKLESDIGATTPDGKNITYTIIKGGFTSGS
ncbi:prepilin-type N-terminal cleavage/methylation domain-containing protein [Romboutsia ilealis]|uniref:Prepilin-type N-terminal cleavage/methylation domain-containing protein n=1 Tax=Romboutsia faecis TaxID=2764597 RepID=A0ABR7JT15_9FIRM|nr:prepilin-type N-terminal cleavage/methylation domain-containing protein [Romboutsia faecis]MBC5998015.1 prepilin-type N-terminal cleavage/methylation domain-containing protein [Romboutsia faecis]MRN25706.1 prepilin-type N-terminal cleavage/methylation domain-containing protein [Romboutsia ilealis]